MREIYINLKVLHIGESRRGNGIISLGGELNEDSDEVTHLRALDIQDHLLLSKTTEEVLPHPVHFLASFHLVMKGIFKKPFL